MKSPNCMHLFPFAMAALIVFTPGAMFAGQPIDPPNPGSPPVREG
jgi:hypothetical protein